MKKFLALTILCFLPLSISSEELGLRCTGGLLGLPSIELIINTSLNTVAFKSESESPVSYSNLFKSSSYYKFEDNKKLYTIDRYSGKLCTVYKGGESCFSTGRFCYETSIPEIREKWSQIKKKF